MPQEIRLWTVGPADQLTECAPAALDLEARLESWLTKDISILSPDLMVIGRQVETAFGGYIDLLCLDRSGDLVIVELKRDRTPREITAQTLDYATWVSELSNESIVQIAAKHFQGGASLEDAYRQRFGDELPESLNDSHRMLIVASKIDPSSERIIRYLSSTYGVSINAVTFRYLQADAQEFLARVFLIDPDKADYQTRTKAGSKRRPNLTYEELENLASDNGVGELYGLLVSGLESVLQKQTTCSSIGFTSILEDSRKKVINLLPGNSSADRGVRFQVYVERLKRLLMVSDDEALAILPATRQPWKYYESADDDYSGYHGFFATRAEVERFLHSFSKSPA